MHGAGMRLDGQGWPMDFVEARRLFGLAAAQGQATAKKREDVRLAQCALGSMHLEGLGGPADLAEARRLLGLASAQGHADARSTSPSPNPLTLTLTLSSPYPHPILTLSSPSPSYPYPHPNANPKSKPNQATPMLSACSPACTARARAGLWTLPRRGG